MTRIPEDGDLGDMIPFQRDDSEPDAESPPSGTTDGGELPDAPAATAAPVDGTTDPTQRPSGTGDRQPEGDTRPEAVDGPTRGEREPGAQHPAMPPDSAVSCEQPSGAFGGAGRDATPERLTGGSGQTDAPEQPADGSGQRGGAGQEGASERPVDGLGQAEAGRSVVAGGGERAHEGGRRSAGAQAGKSFDGAAQGGESFDGAVQAGGAFDGAAEPGRSGG
ncbi:hypothetical protein C1J01_08155, partial [Nonomuraea aridisoli]